MDIFNPKNGTQIATLEVTSKDVLKDLTTKAHAAQKDWSKRSFDDRASYIRKFAAALKENCEALALSQTNETGKPIRQSRGEIMATLTRIDYFLDHAEELLKSSIENQQGGIQEMISYEPLGVIANISAWNYPYFIGTNVYIPALLTGNAVLYKPSEWASLVGQDMARLWQQTELPSGLFQLILGRGDVGSSLLDQNIDAVFFTGSYETGRDVAAKVAPRMIKLGLELGGKDPAYVTDSVDLQKAAESLADGAFYNAGQSCCAVERIYVHHKNYDAFIAAFREQVESFQMGDPVDDSTYIGPLTRRASMDTLTAQIEDALAKGAEILTGGKPADREGNYFEPTVLVKVNHAMKVMRDESFGPIIGIQKVTDDEEAIALMADTRFGLTASVYTNEQNRAEAILERMPTGTVYWNVCDRISPHLPWSGRRRSGIGSTLGKIGIQAFLNPKSWHLKKP